MILLMQNEEGMQENLYVEIESPNKVYIYCRNSKLQKSEL